MRLGPKRVLAPDDVLDLVVSGLRSFADVGDEKLAEMQRDGNLPIEGLAGMSAGLKLGFEAALKSVEAVRKTCKEWEQRK